MAKTGNPAMPFALRSLLKALKQENPSIFLLKGFF